MHLIIIHALLPRNPALSALLQPVNVKINPRLQRALERAEKYTYTQRLAIRDVKRRGNVTPEAAAAYLRLVTSGVIEVH